MDLFGMMSKSGMSPNKPSRCLMDNTKKRSNTMLQQEETRKGPWTEHEDLQLVCFVGLFGDRRWDFIAKVSGLKRTGKSCRLRWVNYLHPGLKRGKMTPHEEKLVLELHSQWGNRWSRIARRLPGRTDNEIKNYWRTHMRKKAQERKRAVSPSSSSSTSNCCSSSSNNPPMDANHAIAANTAENTGGSRFHDAAVPAGIVASLTGKKGQQQEEKVYSMDEIWKDITSTDEDPIKPVLDGYTEEGSSFSCPPIASPLWEYCPGTLWKMDDEERKMFFPSCDQQLLPCYEDEGMLLTG